MKDYLKLRIPYRVRIHGGGCDASARATHHAGKEDRLITNKSAFSTKAELGIVPISTIERKQMSTKTNFKRIASVAVASLGLGVLTSVAPANADLVAATTATTPWAVTAAYASSSNSATQVVGGTVTLTYSETVETDADGDVGIIGNITSTGVGQITNASDTTDANDAVTVQALGTTATTAVYPNTGVSRVTVDAVNAAAVVVYTVTVSSATAGTQTLTASMNNTSGTPTSSKTATITWVASSTTGVSAANSTIYLSPDATACTFGTTVSSDKSAASANGASLVAAGTQLDLCLMVRDGSGNPVGTSASTVVTSSFGVSANSAGSGTDGQEEIDLAAPSSILSGKNTYTVIVIDTFGNVATLSTSVTYYGSLKTLKLTNISYAGAAGGTFTQDAVDTYAEFDALAATTPVGVIGIMGLDANNNPINLNLSANSITTSTWTVDSDQTAGAPANKTKDTSSFTVRELATEIDELAATKYGTNVAYVDCGTVKEKVTLTVFGKDSDNADVKSNSVDFYCSGATDKVTVTATGTSVNVNVTDASGYPVADGTSVALAASNGSVVAPSSKTTSNGKFATAATFIANSTAATSSVTAIVGSKSGTSAAVAGTGTSIESQIASMLKLIQKIMKKMGIK